MVKPLLEAGEAAVLLDSNAVGATVDSYTVTQSDDKITLTFSISFKSDLKFDPLVPKPIDSDTRKFAAFLRGKTSGTKTVLVTPHADANDVIFLDFTISGQGDKVKHGNRPRRG